MTGLDDAIQFWVRGFHDIDTGERLTALLEGIGFTIKFRAAGGSDDNGGIIETYITPEGELDPSDIDEIKAMIHRSVDEPGIYCQWATYAQKDGSED